ncbi:MAG: tetratricopeptide repeat protein [Magnetococcus sp. MYC-9]
MTLPPSTSESSAELLATAKRYHGQGDLPRAAILYEQLLAIEPRNPELLHLSGLLFLGQGDAAKAVKRISLALLSCPDHPVLTNSLGLALLEQGQCAAAMDRFKDAIRLQPEYAEPYAHWGRALLQLQRDAEAVAPLQQALRLDPQHAEACQLLAIALRALPGMELLIDYHQKLAWHYGGQSPTTTRTSPEHTFFLDRHNALATARQALRVPETIAVSGLQICYYLTAPGATEEKSERPANAIPVPLEPHGFEAFFLTSRLSAPTRIDFDPAKADERQLAQYIVTHLYNARLARLQAIQQWSAQCRQTPPHGIPGQPWRVYVATSRKTTVMQYNARDLAQGFRQQECEVLFVVESDDRESLDGYHRVREQAAFNPHIVVNINHLNNDHLHPEVFNITWWQDRMEALTAGRPLPWRERDLIYAIDQKLDPFLYRCAAPQVVRQGFCYDDALFRNHGQVRREKVVVVASSYRNLPSHPQTATLLAILQERFATGEPLTDEELDRLAATHAYPREELFWHLWHYVVRDQSVRWLCGLAEQIEVEVYGRYWEGDAVVRPFFKGEVPHGAAVAAIYNEARYALVPHPFDLQSQRLMEVAACGAIPIVYDCRHRAEPPHWDDHCLWFRTEAELRACVTRTPPQPPHALCQGRSYGAFAQKILAEIQHRLRGTNPA